MKDAAHHKKQLQKKVIRSSRQSGGSSIKIPEKINQEEINGAAVPAQVFSKKGGGRVPVLRASRSRIH